MRLIINFL